MKKSNVKIENDKIIFSKEVLDYFNGIRTEENSIWIDKYFEVLSDIRNIDSNKFNIHHIRPCFSFKINSHTLRKDAEKLADKFNENLVKLSIYNHFFAHYYLWKIFNNRDSKVAFQRMCGQGKYVDNLTEQELQKIARLKEECTKKNQTKEEKLKKDKIYYNLHQEDIKNYRNSHKESIKKYNEKYRKENSEAMSESKKKWYLKNKDELKEKHKKNYEENKEKILKHQKEYAELNKEKISENKRNYYYSHKEEIAKKKSEYYYTHKEQKKKRDRKYESQMCYDPKKDNFCTVKTLGQRKYRHKEEYKDVIIANCIIK